MRLFLLHSLFICLAFTSCHEHNNSNSNKTASKVPVKLEYIPNVSLGHKNEISIEINYEDSNAPILIEAAEYIKGDLFLIGPTKEGADQTPLFEPPFDLRFKLKKFLAAMKIGEKEWSMNSEEAGTLSEDQFLKFDPQLNNPFILHFNDNYNLTLNPKEWLPILGHETESILPFLQKILSELFQYSFVLAGKDLIEGETYSDTKDNRDYQRLLDFKLAYTVTEINDEEITASIVGNSSLQSFKFNIPADAASVYLGMAQGKNLENNGNINDSSSSINEPFVVEISMDGKSQGQGVWQRNNGLISHIRNEINCLFTVKLNDTELPPIKVKLIHEIQTR